MVFVFCNVQVSVFLRKKKKKLIGILKCVKLKEKFMSNINFYSVNENLEN